MRSIQRLSILFLLGIAPLLAADVTGKWEGTGTTPDGAVETLNVVLKVEGGAIKGDIGPNADKRFQIASGKVDGTKVTFHVEGPNGGTFDFDLTLDGGSMKGTCHLKRGEDAEDAKVELKRAS